MKKSFRILLSGLIAAVIYLVISLVFSIDPLTFIGEHFGTLGNFLFFILIAAVTNITVNRLQKKGL